jgi:hypothetical protein
MKNAPFSVVRNLEVPEVRKFEAMLAWARHKIRTKTSSKLDAKLEFKCIMERLARDLKLYRISPQELIKVCYSLTRIIPQAEIHASDIR